MKWLWREVDPASLVVFRAVIGVMGAISAARYFWYGWIDQFFYRRQLFFHFPGFEWVQPLPRPGMHVVFGLLILFGLMIAVGWLYRLSAAAYLLLFTYVGLVDTTNYLNHYWFFRFVLLLMVWMPLERAGSIDAGLSARHSESAAPSPRMPAWPVWTLRAQIGILYFFAGVGKLQTDWLFRAQPMDLWLSARTHFPVVGPWFGAEWLPYTMSIAGALFDLTIVGWLLWPKSRPFAYAAVVGFHAATGWLFNIGMFPLIMIGLTPIFFEPDWPRRWLPESWLRALGVPKPARPDSTSGPSKSNSRESTRAVVSPRHRRFIAWGLAVWFALQIALPLRHIVYPGVPRWTHEGFRFSWRVKLIEKTGSLSFRIRPPDGGKTWRIDPSRYLTPRQEALASGDPQKILQLAHHIQAELERSGHGDVQILADAWVSLNGRNPQRLIDPEVDLADQPRDLWHDDWILPLNHDQLAEQPIGQQGAEQ